MMPCLGSVPATRRVRAEEIAALAPGIDVVAVGLRGGKGRARLDGRDRQGEVAAGICGTAARPHHPDIPG
jgi:hypothetical protein